MRDILVTILVMTGCFYTLKRPYVGVYLWSWLIYMNPQSLCYGFALHAPYTKITALVLLGSVLYNKETKPLPVNATTFIWIVFILFMGVTTYFAYFPDTAFIQYLKVIHIQLLVFLTMMLITDIEKLNKLIWVIVLSVGFFTAKGGLYYLMIGGNFNLWGPSGTSIEPPIELAIAGLIVMPMMVYLCQISNDKWVKLGLVTAIVLSLLTLIKSQSGAVFFGIFVAGIFYSIKKLGYIKVFALLIGLLILLLCFMPESWVPRRDAMIHEGGHSSMGQINAWLYAINSANDHLLGMGFKSWSPETFAKYAPNPLDVHEANSIYFTILADHGWFGLTLFLLILFMAWRKLVTIIKETAKKQDCQEAHSLASLLQYGFIAYLFGGAFVNLANFALPWHLIAIVMILSRIVASQPVAVKTWTSSAEELNSKLNQTSYESDDSYHPDISTKEKPQSVSANIPKTTLTEWYRSKEIIAEQSAWIDSEEGESAFWEWCDSNHFFMYEIGTEDAILEKLKQWSNLNVCESYWLRSLWHHEAFNRWMDNHKFSS